ncbi:TPA: hypothetical protein MD627_005612 [Citrobacter freundii]|uniref:hypothetical protein n=1 Tax=Citrobacter freundii complex TaxID=1344959 RepID=UPI00202391D3|nr:hypothetical protein [Citrobacter freundii]HCC5908302.1 hypothetical protein [Citrobacter freundii]
MPFTPTFRSTAYASQNWNIEVIEPDFPGLTIVKPLGLFRADGTLALLINFFTHH